jgi:hypothetical protein
VLAAAAALDRLAVHEHHAVDDVDPLAGQPDDPLHEVLARQIRAPVGRIGLLAVDRDAEHHHLAALGRAQPRAGGIR